MALRLNKTPSLWMAWGVKRWTYDLDANNVLHVFDRPAAVRPSPDSPRFMLRLEKRDGTHVGTDFRKSRIGAEQHARHIHHDVCDISEDPSFAIIIRAKYEPGIRGVLANHEVTRRGLWL